MTQWNTKNDIFPHTLLYTWVKTTYSFRVGPHLMASWSGGVKEYAPSAWGILPSLLFWISFTIVWFGIFKASLSNVISYSPSDGSTKWADFLSMVAGVPAFDHLLNVVSTWFYRYPGESWLVLWRATTDQIGFPRSVIGQAELVLPPKSAELALHWHRDTAPELLFRAGWWAPQSPLLYQQPLWQMPERLGLADYRRFRLFLGKKAPLSRHSVQQAPHESQLEHWQ